MPQGASERTSKVPQVKGYHTSRTEAAKPVPRRPPQQIEPHRSGPQQAEAAPLFPDVRLCSETLADVLPTPVHHRAALRPRRRLTG